MNRIEETLQMDVVEFLHLALLPGTVFFHVPNGGKRSINTAKRFKKMGLRAGIPDLVFIFDGRAHFIELKAPGGSKSKAQREMHPLLADAGCPVAICKSLPEVEGALAAWSIPMRVVN